MGALLPVRASRRRISSVQSFEHLEPQAMQQFSMTSVDLVLTICSIGLHSQACNGGCFNLKEAPQTARRPQHHPQCPRPARLVSSGGSPARPNPAWVTLAALAGLFILPTHAAYCARRIHTCAPGEAFWLRPCTSCCNITIGLSS